jgi:hypothetical protein
MACKLKCPSCGNVLKEEGDECKQARGEYRVYDSLGNSEHPASFERLIKCLSCLYIGNVCEFDDWGL